MGKKTETFDRVEKVENFEYDGKRKANKNSQKKRKKEKGRKKKQANKTKQIAFKCTEYVESIFVVSLSFNPLLRASVCLLRLEISVTKLIVSS